MRKRISDISVSERNGIRRFTIFLISFLMLFINDIGLIKAADSPAFPTKSIHIVIPGSAGGSNDRETRTLAPSLEKILGVRVVIDYIPGAQGMIAYNKFYKEKSDGYTLLSASSLSPVILEVSKKVDYVTKDYSFIGAWNSKSQGVFVNAEAWDAFDKLLRDAKQRTLSLATVGGVGFLQVKLLEDAFGIKFNFVPYKSGGESLSALAGKHVDIVLTYSSSALPLIRAKKIRAIATCAPNHDPFLPGVPNFSDLGYNQVYSLVALGGLFAPPDTPSGIISILENALGEAVKDAQFLKMAKNSWIAVDYLSSAQAKEAVQKDYDIVSKYKQVMTGY